MSYPCLIFWTLANLNFALVIWPFFWSLLASRVAIFLVAVAAEWGWNGINPDSIANAGIYGVFVSQSNDVSVGVPIMTAVFGKAHPDWPVLLYIGMLTRVMVNPFGFYMMQWGQIKKAEERRLRAEALGIQPHEVAQTPRTQEDRDADAAAAAGPFGSDIPSADDPDNLDLNLPQSQSALVGLIIKRVFVNPLVLSSVLGIIANWIFSGHLPGLVDKFFELLGRCYNASSLFVLGVAMHGQLDRLADRRQLKIPLWLFVGKCVILPVLARFIAVWCGLGKTSPDLVLFSFVLATFPPSISLPFFAYEYKVPVQHIIAPAMVLGTILAAPMMFIAAQMVNITVNPGGVDDILESSLRVFSGFGIASATYFLLILWYNRRFTSVRDRLLIALIFFQLIFNISSETCGAEALSTGLQHLRYGIVFSARLATRFGMLAMAINEVLHYALPQAGSGAASPRGGDPERSRKYFPLLAGGVVLLSVLVAILAASWGSRTIAKYKFVDCYQRYGRVQWIFSSVIDIASLIILTYCMIKISRARALLEEKEDSAGSGSGANGGAGTAGRSGSLRRQAYTAVAEGDEDTSSARGEGSPDDSSSSSSVHIHAHADRDDEKKEGLRATAAALSRRSSAIGSSAMGLHLHASPSLHGSAHVPASTDFYAPTPRVREEESFGPEDEASAVEEDQSWAFGMQIFLIVGYLWLILNLILSLWSAKDPTSATEARIELQLLELVLASGQSIWTWLLFGLAGHVKTPLTRVTAWIREQSNTLANWQSS